MRPQRPSIGSGPGLGPGPAVGAALAMGSLLNNGGGTLAPGGGYGAGRADLIGAVAARLAAPGIGTDAGGVGGETLRVLFQGLFMGSQVRGEGARRFGPKGRGDRRGPSEGGGCLAARWALPHAANAQAGSRGGRRLPWPRRRDRAPPAPNGGRPQTQLPKPTRTPRRPRARRSRAAASWRA